MSFLQGNEVLPVKNIGAWFEALSGERTLEVAALGKVSGVRGVRVTVIGCNWIICMS